jgi:PAS domain S-box-containing protein
MSTKELKQPIPEVDEAQLKAWISVIAPGLKSRWANYFANVPPQQIAPNLADWLALLHAAATNPWKISHYLSQLLKKPKSSAELQQSWVTLTNLFGLTFQAAQAEANQLDGIAWRSLAEIQTRILKAASANLALVRDNRPDTKILSRRALYLQTVIDLNRKIVDHWHPGDLLNEVVSLIQQNFQYDYVNLFLLDQATQKLELRSAAWKDHSLKTEDFISLKMGDQGAVGRVAATGQITLVNDVSQESSFLPHPSLPEVKAQLAAPLLVGNNLVGVLEIESDQVHAFSEVDRQIIHALTDHVAVAIENARLQTTLQRRMREQTLIYESNVALGTNLDVDTVLRLMTQKIAEAMDAGACVICRIDPKAMAITALAEYVFRYPGNPPHTWRRLNVPVHISKDSIGQQLLKANRPIIGRADPKKSTDKQVWEVPSGDGDRKNSWKVVLAVPLETEKRVIGLVEIYDKNPNRNFSPDDIQFCRILASQTSLALERARLFDETRQRLSEVATLYTMAQKFSSNLQLQTVLDTIVDSLRYVLSCRGCCIFLLDKSGQNLEIQAASGLKPHWRKMAKLRLGEGAAGRAAAEVQTIYIPDTHQDPGFIFFDEEVRSLLVTPLLVQGQVIGTINVDDAQPNAFGPSQERLLTIMATQAGIAIENARLFANVAKQQQQTQAIIQYMADGVLLIDGQGVIVTCNPALALMLEIHPGQILGQKVNSPDLHPHLAGITAITTRRARTGVLTKEVTIQTPRPRTLQVFSTTVVDEIGQPLGEVRVVHDITRERELEQLKDDFMSTVSHELRTPLFSIQGFVQVMLENDNLDPATHREFLTIIQIQAIQLSQMVNNLLDLSKFDEGKLELERKPVALLDLIHQTTLKLQGFAHQQKVKLSTQLPGLLPTVIADAQRLEQVLTNLIGNAIKFTNAGGEVSVMASASDTELLVQVKDNGIGIPAEALERIFSRYYQVEDRSERYARGSGLGLHIAQRIINEHGGRIWAESEAGQGSTFCFTLPLSNGSASK